jgi:hypothetical protein
MKVLRRTKKRRGGPLIRGGGHDLRQSLKAGDLLERGIEAARKGENLRGGGGRGGQENKKNRASGREEAEAAQRQKERNRKSAAWRENASGKREQDSEPQ